MKNKIGLIISIFFFLLSNILLASEALFIKADTLQLNQKTQKLKLTGNVRLNYENFNIIADQLEIDQKNYLVINKKPSILLFKNQKILVERLRLNLKKRNGILEKLSGKTNNITWKTDRLEIKNNIGTFQNVFITPCKQNEPLVFYLTCKKGKIDQNKNTLYLEKNKLYFLNRNIYSINEYRRGEIQSASERSGFGFPRIYNNKYEGFSITSTLPIIYSKNLYTTFLIGHTGNNGIKTGLEANYKVLKNNKISGFLYSYGKTKPSSNLSYTYYQPINQKKKPFLGTILNTQKAKSYFEFYVKTFQNHYINYELIDIHPKIGIRFNKVFFPFGFTYSSEFFNAIITEGNVTSHKTELFNQLKHPLPSIFNFNNEISIDSTLRYYKDNQKWFQHYANFLLKKQSKTYELNISYRKQLTKNIGSSVFLFDQNTASINDEIGLLFSVPIQNFRFGTKIDYDLKENEYRNTSYFVNIHLFCNTNITLNLNTTWNTFSANFTFPLDKKFKKN